MNLQMRFLLVLPALTFCACSVPVAQYPAPSASRSEPQPDYRQDQHSVGTPLKNRQRAKPAAPKLKKLKNGHYRVSKPWTVRLSTRTFHIPKGYTSNGISAPSYVKQSLGDHVNAPETWAAVFHDWCFTQKSISRSQADDYFIELMHAYRIPQHKIDMMGTAARSYTLYKLWK